MSSLYPSISWYASACSCARSLASRAAASSAARRSSCRGVMGDGKGEWYVVHGKWGLGAGSQLGMVLGHASLRLRLGQRSEAATLARTQGTPRRTAPPAACAAATAALHRGACLRHAPRANPAAPRHVPLPPCYLPAVPGPLLCPTPTCRSMSCMRSFLRCKYRRCASRCALRFGRDCPSSSS